ncbi:conserved exported hypothetical protein [Paraburkholderia ribeironis]|uniref:Pentapeptide repeat protein n=1 Tax=Paraburkholderia ribeironis TaxID=1247936 RepID=A0A1N7SFT4_9BURK|nr:hypothetical protein [Paraburkholderia ribeironis]SIT46221.1 conserved exported hypothetical protein [Paraburkholderia ribeironis]
MRTFRLCVVLGLFWLFGSGQFNLAHASASVGQDMCQQYASNWTATERQVWGSICQTGQSAYPRPCGEQSFRGEFTHRNSQRQRAVGTGLFQLGFKITSPPELALQTVRGDAYVRCFERYLPGFADIPDFGGAAVVSGAMQSFSGRLVKTVLPRECGYVDAISGQFLAALLTQSPYRERIADKGFKLAGVRITGNLDLTGRTIPGNMEFDCFYFDNASFGDVTSNGSLKFQRGGFEKAPSFEGSRVKGTLVIDEVTMPRLYAAGIVVDKTLALSLPSKDLELLQLDGSTLGKR